MTDERHDSEGIVEAPVVRDRRRIDPETGQVRGPEENPAPQSGAGAPAAGDTPPGEVAAENIADDQLARARAEAAERLDDLKRLQAEYVNYRRRVERDRDVVRENAKVEILSSLLSVLDDIGRAREHGDLTGAFRAVGEALESAVAKAGLEQYGEAGDPFDPTIHEAFMHGYADDVDVPTCTQILQPGYRVGERIVRPARVAVAEPTEALPDSGENEGDATSVADAEQPEAASDSVEDDGAEEVSADEQK